jgi:hypothetical protein
LPVFFSGLVFSSSFKRFDRPAEMLGINLLGAVLGGILENAVMIGGSPMLKSLALAMYAASAVALFRIRLQPVDPLRRTVLPRLRAIERLC